MDVGDAGVLGLLACQQACPGAALATAGFADEDGAVLVDFLDDGDVPVFAAGSLFLVKSVFRVSSLIFFGFEVVTFSWTP